MKLLPAALLLAALAACSPAAEEAPDAATPDADAAPADAAEEARSADAETAAWLAGSWVIQGEPCETDLGLNFHADGTYSIYEESGDWEVSGDELRLTPREISEMGEPTPPQRIENPETVVQTIEARDENSYRTRFEDGETLTMARCPSE